MQGWLLHSVSAPECLPPARQHSSCRVKAVTMTAMAPACMEPPLRRERHQTGELSKRKGPCRLRQVGGFTGEGEKVLVGRGARWPSRACSCEPPHARCEDLGFLSPQVAKGSRLSGKSDACLQPGLPGEWHVWGADLSFTLQSALWNVLGLPPVSCTWWAGRHAARTSRTAGRGEEGTRRQRRLLETATGRMKASEAVPPPRILLTLLLQESPRVMFRPPRI